MGREGRPKNFEKPEELLEAWNLFKKDVEEQSNEWKKFDYVGKDGFRVEDGLKVPYTLEGFKRFCRVHYGEVKQYFENQDGLYNEFMDICHAIKEEIRENQIIGGMLGFYNPSITQRLNGLTDRQDLTTKGEALTNQPPTIEVYNSAPKLASSEDDIEE